MIKIAIAVLIIYLIYVIERIIYYNRKFKEDSKYPCFVVISQDGFISKPMHYEGAKVYSDAIYGIIKVDREEYNQLKYKGDTIQE
jgi:hypothetical protein